MQSEKWRPLATDPGRALGLEVLDAPAHAHDVLLGALERLSKIDLMAVDAEASEGMALRDAVLRGFAAAAIVADADSGERVHTGALDFAVNGREAVFLPEGVTLATLLVASSAMEQANWALSVVFAEEPVPEGHREAAEVLRGKLALAARSRLKGVSRRG